MSIEPRTVIGEVKCPFCGSAAEAMVGAQKGNRTVMACPRGCRGTAGAFPDRDLKQDYLDATSETEREDHEQDTVESEETGAEIAAESEAASEGETGTSENTGTDACSIAGNDDTRCSEDTAGAREQVNKPARRKWGSGKRV
ncbi:hypothetical protein [Kordiimonas aquimaris]|uniref:hypothetical protein n=1 Tax=Kordiimonas aquimaris TaxID=707591 RepID=UPI0021D0B5D4|nr:hypothetical protein [Kordiimonas aquimaris]